MQTFLAVSEKTSRVLSRYASSGANAPAKIRQVIEQLVSQSRIEPLTVTALAAVVERIAAMSPHAALASADKAPEISAMMYLPMRRSVLTASTWCQSGDAEAIKNYRRVLDRANKFLPGQGRRPWRLGWHDGWVEAS